MALVALELLEDVGVNSNELSLLGVLGVLLGDPESLVAFSFATRLMTTLF